MPTERYVNRVDQSPLTGFAEAPTQDKLPTYDVLTGKTEYHTPPNVGPDVITHDSSEESEDNIGNTVKYPLPGFQGGSVEAVLMDIALRIQQDYGREQRFRTQVLAALRHLGLDVRKFFPE